MIFVICGMIGAGKSTYAKEKFAFSTECEDGDKTAQIKATLELNIEVDSVAHVTTYPTSEELETFPDATYIWINTDYQKCYENILKRHRKRDIDNLNETLEANRVIRDKYYSSDIRFLVEDVFDSGERW